MTKVVVITGGNGITGSAILEHLRNRRRRMELHYSHLSLAIEHSICDPRYLGWRRRISRA